jgi:hypothetical protein
MPDNLSMDPTQVGLDFWLKPVAPEDMPMIAAVLLSDGYDSPALREVAGLGRHDDPRDVRSAFQQALIELDAWLPDRIAAYVHISRSVAAAILSGEASMHACTRRICEVIEFDEVIYHALPPALEDFARMCWLYGSGDLYEENGGHRRLIETAAALAAASALCGQSPNDVPCVGCPSMSIAHASDGFCQGWAKPMSEASLPLTGSGRHPSLPLVVRGAHFSPDRAGAECAFAGDWARWPSSPWWPWSLAVRAPPARGVVAPGSPCGPARGGGPGGGPPTPERPRAEGGGRSPSRPR